MMKQYIVDAFIDEVFKENPATVCMMEQWLNEKLIFDYKRLDSSVIIGVDLLYYKNGYTNLPI